MKSYLLLAAVALLAAFTLHAAETARVWTNDKGKTVTGILKEKTATHASILLDSGKRVEIPIATLAQADQDYIAKAEVFPEPDLAVANLPTEKDEAKHSQRFGVSVTPKNSSGRPLKVAVVWFFDLSSGMELHKAQEQTLDRDLPLDFWLTLDQITTKKAIPHAVGLFDEQGALVTSFASDHKLKNTFATEEWKKVLPRKPGK